MATPWTSLIVSWPSADFSARTRRHVGTSLSSAPTAIPSLRPASSTPPAAPCKSVSTVQQKTVLACPAAVPWRTSSRTTRSTICLTWRRSPTVDPPARLTSVAPTTPTTASPTPPTPAPASYCPACESRSSPVHTVGRVLRTVSRDASSWMAKVPQAECWSLIPQL